MRRVPYPEKTKIGNISTQQEERTFAEVKRLSLAGLEGSELLHQTARRFKLAVPFEAYCLATTDPASNLMTNRVDGGTRAKKTGSKPNLSPSNPISRRTWIGSP